MNLEKLSEETVDKLIDRELRQLILYIFSYAENADYSTIEDLLKQKREMLKKKMESTEYHNIKVTDIFPFLDNLDKNKAGQGIVNNFKLNEEFNISVSDIDFNLKRVEKK